MQAAFHPLQPLLHAVEDRGQAFRFDQMPDLGFDGREAQQHVAKVVGDAVHAEVEAMQHRQR